jgi:HEAT repeat protein
VLNPEQAQQMLKEFHLENERKERLKALGKLQGDLGKAGQLLFKDEKGGQYWQARLEQIAEAVQILDRQKPADRLRFFATLFPGIEQYVEDAWQLQITRLPYQIGWLRKAFRAPNNPEITQLARGRWLVNLFEFLAHYRQDITWFAAWAAYLNRYRGSPRLQAPPQLGALLAAAIDSGDPAGDEVFDILLASANGEHEIGAMGRHVIRAMLIASRPDGWEFVEKLLVAAQRQEGLRQVILESIDECHPEAFRRLVRVMLDQDLLRFSAAMRAVDVWFGMGWKVEDVRTVRTFLERLGDFLEHPQAVEQALEGEDAEAVYMALWVLATGDAVGAIKIASGLLADASAEKRFAVAHLLGQLGLPETRQILQPLLADEDLRVVARVLSPLAVYRGAEGSALAGTDFFERLEALLPRLTTKTKTLKPIIWPWMVLGINRESVADQLVSCLGDRSPRRLIPYLGLMSVNGRGFVAKAFGGTDKKDAEVREALFALLGDRSNWVRERALQGIAGLSITGQEALDLEGLLHRKAGDLRRAVLSLLLNRKDEEVLESADRLLEASNMMNRLAGLELLRLMSDDDRRSEVCRARAGAYRAARTRLSNDEETLLDVILREPEKVATLDDALGLLNPAEQTPPVRPKPRKRPYITRAAIECVQSLDALARQYSRTLVTYHQWSTQKEELLGNLPWYHLRPNPQTPIEEDVARLPLREVWEDWWHNRPAKLRDRDGLELVRALALTPLPGGGQQVEDSSAKKVAGVVLNSGNWDGQLKYSQLVRQVVRWLLRLHPPDGAGDFLLDAVETSVALIPKSDLGRLAEKPPAYYHRDLPSDLWWRSNQVVMAWLGLAREYRQLCPSGWNDEHRARLWHLLRWVDVPGVEAPRFRPLLGEMLGAFKASAATEADLIDHLLGPRPVSGRQTRVQYGRSFGELRHLTGRKPDSRFAYYPGLESIVNRCRQRIVEVECTRGEMPTAASEPARRLRAVFGIDTLLDLAQALGRGNLVRGWSYDGWSKETVLSHLIRVTVPLEEDTVEEFARRVAEVKISDRRLIDMAVYAPQWACYIEHALGWEGLEEAVWWIHAHTKDSNWRVDQEVRELWSAEVAERTPLTAQDLIDGAVDVAWFHRVYETLGEERWAILYESAKYASGGRGHARATLFADAMLGRLDKQALINRFTKKRHQDSVRALGLLHLAEGADGEVDLLKRYESLQEFLRTGKKYGSMRRTNEKLAVGIAMQNLARTAGYADPIRLEWAMEAQANADMADGSLTATVEDVTVTLAIDAWGDPAISVERQGRRLKSVPAKVKKEPAIAHLLGRKKDIKRQTSRMRKSLEQAMCRGDTFTVAELRSLMGHPILAPMLEQLVFVSDGTMGYPVGGGRALQRHDASRVKIGTGEQLRIAHPHDLLLSGEWHEWQRECFLAERIQPFKQVFRELYVLTETEKAEGNLSRRYAGHQVQPKQAAALLGQRGWVIHPEEGARRVFHEAGVAVWLSGLIGFLSPAEVEGETLEGVHFTRRGEWEPLPLEEVPPRVFSEAMRDLDLVVSVAHVGGVDPEASASTVEMRAALVRETCRLLEIDNARVERSHVLIDGELGNYSVHLGSAMVHRQPGGAVCIIPVHSQHRGRLFLPFADDDPRTAEVVSKVILLGRDSEIKDPTILEQLLAVY